MAYIDFISRIHKSTKRNYLEERVIHCDKAQCARIAKKFGVEYWDGERKYGYGGYRYDGRWRALAEDLARHYLIKEGDRVLDVGCGKGYLLYEFTQAVPGVEVAGLDISTYAISHAKEEIKRFLTQGNATVLPYPDKSFDFVVSINTLHNLYVHDLEKALKEIERVAGQNKKYIVVDSYRTENEKVNLLYWQLTCECFYTPEEWRWVFEKAGYTGDFGFVYYE